MDFLIGNKDYPLEAEWFEYNPKATIDDDDTWEGAIPFTYKDVTRNRLTQQSFQGLKRPTNTIVIETRARLLFKPRDLVKLDRGTYKVTQVDFVADKNYSAKHFLKNDNFHIAVLVLE